MKYKMLRRCSIFVIVAGLSLLVLGDLAPMPWEGAKTHMIPEYERMEVLPSICILLICILWVLWVLLSTILLYHVRKNKKKLVLSVVVAIILNVGMLLVVMVVIGCAYGTWNNVKKSDYCKKCGVKLILVKDGEHKQQVHLRCINCDTEEREWKCPYCGNVKKYCEYKWSNFAHTPRGCEYCGYKYGMHIDTWSCPKCRKENKEMFREGVKFRDVKAMPARICKWCGHEDVHLD